MIEIEYLRKGVELLGEEYGFERQENAAGVLGYGHGLLARDGVWTDELGLVLLVRRGAPGFPYGAVTVNVGGIAQDVPCCTFVLDGYPYVPVPAAPVVGDPPLQLGAPISRVPSHAEGTWACFSLGDPALAFSAAHLFAGVPLGGAVYCGTRQVGTVQEVESDVAVIALAESAARAAQSVTVDGLPVGGSTRMGWRTIGSAGTVYCPTRGASARPRILAADMTVHLLEMGGRTITQRNTIMTEGCTHPGDSGTGLISPDGFVVGVLSHGRKEFSFFEAF